MRRPLRPRSTLRNLALLGSLGLTLAACQGGKAEGDKSGDKSGAKTGDKSGAQATDKGKAGSDKAKAGDKGDSVADKGGDAPAADAPWSWTLPGGISTPPVVPDDNPMTAAKVALGHQLFMDKRLSGDGSRSCYSCHQNELGNADGRTKALGPGDKVLARNTPTIWNVALHQNGLYWDGRAATLEKQAIGAWKGGNMAESNLDAKAREIGGLPEYKDQFVAVFGLKDGEVVTPDHVAKALSAYERTLLCGDTGYDKNELSEAAARGWELFRGKAACTTCHNGDNFSDGAYHNIGLAYDDDGKLREGADIGRGKVSGEADNYQFRTPTLRNVAQTAPYFHDGRAKTLEEAVRYMAAGGNAKAPGLDPNLRNTQLTDAEIADVIAFLEALNCPGELEVIGDQTVAGIPEPAAEPAAG